MHFNGRQARKSDFAEAQHLIADRFLYSRGDIDALLEMWEQIIAGESGYSSVITGPAPRPLLAFGISVALKPEFVEQIAAHPQPFIAARIFQAWKRGDSPIMNRQELGSANAAWGVDVFVLHHGYAPAKDEPEYYGVVMALAAQFVRQHAGLNLRSLSQEFYERSWLDLALRHGFSVRQDFGRTFFAGVHRSEVLSPDRGDFVTNPIFASVPAPRLGLDNSERQLVRAALDESDAARNWPDGFDGLYERIINIDPATGLMNRGNNSGDLVLAWMRSHPEELHPYATPDAMPLV